MTDPILKTYYDAHDAMMDAEREDIRHPLPGWWAFCFGLYKVNRYNAVKAGLIPETPQFDVEDAR